MNNTKAKPPAMAVIATPAPAPRLASTIASTIQALASSMAPAESANVPSGELESPRSRMMRANIGKAVMAMHAPMNKIACGIGTLAANRPGVCSNHGVSTTASAKGAAMPESETAAALGAFDLKCETLKPSPTMNM